MLDLGFIKIYTRKEDRKKLREYIEEKTLAESLFEINKKLMNKIKESNDTLLEYMNIITENKKEIKNLKTLLTKNKINYKKEEKCIIH